MFYTKDHKTGYIFDPWHYLGPKRRKLLDESWAGLFRKDILCELPVDKLVPFFTEDFGRPTKELYAMLGALIIQQMCDLSDEETMAQVAFNLQWHYALNISDESDASKYLCPKTLWNMRKIVTDNELDIVLFDQTTDRLARIFKVDTDKQRLDSLHIKSNMRRLGRIGIFVKSIHRFLVNLKRQHTEMFETVPQDLVDKYLPEKALACFSMVKPSDSERTLVSVSTDLFDLAQRFSNHSEITSMNSYGLLLRVLKEHCNVTEASDDKPAEVLVKPSKEIPSNSLQNPSDPDAGYDGHKGQGYHIQVMETYCDEEDKDVKSTKLNLITHIEVKPACESDVHALIPALESTEDRGLAPKEVLVDTLYGSDENREAADAMGVKVISPTMGSKESTINLSDFELSEKGKVISCPNGHAPVKIKTKKNRHSVAFDSEHCNNCPLINDCPVNKGKKYHYLRYDDKALRIAKRRAAEQTPEFKERYRWRAGVEGTMSEYNARTGVKRLRVRGLKAVRFCAMLKAIGINIFRATAVRKAVSSLMGTSERQSLGLGRVFLVFKEQFETIWGRLRNTATPFSCNHQFGLKMAA
ncbi:MAG: transposase [Deltaproteobacteria bacterium]|nr:transposase [Deltaproteobacteria bacterium]